MWIRVKKKKSSAKGLPFSTVRHWKTMTLVTLCATLAVHFEDVMNFIFSHMTHSNDTVPSTAAEQGQTLESTNIRDVSNIRMRLSSQSTDYKCGDLISPETKLDYIVIGIA